MKTLVNLFGTLMLAMGFVLLIKPAIIFGWVENNLESSSLYFIAIVLRLGLGVLFVMAAKGSKFPGIIKFFGYLFLLSAIILIFIGQDNFRHFIETVLADLNPFAPAIGIIAIAFGGFLVYAFTGKKVIS